jgi:hypothetical protein
LFQDAIFSVKSRFPSGSYTHRFCGRADYFDVAPFSPKIFCYKTPVTMVGLFFTAEQASAIKLLG